MRRTLTLALLTCAGFPNTSSACDCFGNDSYCATLDPSWFVNPVSTVLAVKLTDYYYGITVKVVQVIGGQQMPDDTLTVWGDNGALCRIYLNGFAIGDTVVFGLNECDLWGNTITAGFPPDLEQPGDYMVSVCGVYWLNYDNGLVNGPIMGSSLQSMTLEEFAGAVQSCSSANSIGALAWKDQVMVRYLGGALVLERPNGADTAELLISDAQGRLVVRQTWNGRPLSITGMAEGLYIIQVSYGAKRWDRKVLVAN